MSITFTYNADLGIVEIICKGKISYDELKNKQAPVFALTKEHNTVMHLLDLTNYESSLSTVQILSSVSPYSDNTSRRLRIAVMLPISEKAQKDIQFYETVCLNRGWNVRLFVQRQKAIDWLVNRKAE